MTQNKSNPKFFATLFSDLIHFFNTLLSGRFFRNIKNDVRAINDFFIDQDNKKRLQTMGRLRRWFHIIIWLLKSLILKMSSFRRILFVLALLFILSAPDRNNRIIIAFSIFIFLLLLELKDKLIARRELEAGRAVQRALMPEECPEVSGWDIWLYSRPANDVGGDLVDFVKVPDHSYGLVLGDVAGKGLGAALLMSKLQSTLRALVAEKDSLGDLATKMNRIFYRDTPSSSFASMIYLELKTDLPEIKLINAGHQPPLLIKSGEVKNLPKGSQALGLSATVKYKEENLILAKSELLLIYSDGLSEARNQTGQFFGEERILNLVKNLYGLPAQSAGNQILREIDSFAAATAQTDDLSLIILKKK